MDEGLILIYIKTTYNLPPTRRYDRRNFISAGAAAGVASAFKAPIGGLLFVLEEISSFWTHKLAWQTFFCCGVATFTTQAFNSIYHTGSLGAFSGAVFNIEEAINSQLTMFLPTIGVGVIGGLFAALFTWANLKICKCVARPSHPTQHKHTDKQPNHPV